jgi:hypothetical protein
VTAAGLSAGLDCAPGDIVAVLRKRGDDALAENTAEVLGRRLTERLA